jgi:D-arginine dehydrogenase
VGLAPLLRADRVAAAAYERGVMDIDVSALHQGYLRGFKQRGGSLVSGKRIGKLEHQGGLWHAAANDATFSARVVINAGGAWADQIGALAGAAGIGLVATRRTAITLDVPPDLDISAMPAVDYAGSDAYFKPDAGRLLASPGDRTAIEPQDVQPDEFDIAVLVDWLEHETTLSVRRIASSWAGLRCFVADEAPVVGFDPVLPNFFWLAGQGGYGIMMAPALGRATAGLVLSGALPPSIKDTGIEERDLSPARLLLPH